MRLALGASGLGWVRPELQLGLWGKLAFYIHFGTGPSIGLGCSYQNFIGGLSFYKFRLFGYRRSKPELP